MSCKAVAKNAPWLSGCWNHGTGKRGSRREAKAKNHDRDLRLEESLRDMLIYTRQAPLTIRVAGKAKTGKGEKMNIMLAAYESKLNQLCIAAKIEIINKTLSALKPLLEAGSTQAKIQYDRLSEELPSLEWELEYEPISSGTVEEFDALSNEEQSEWWNTFHDKCAQGTADDLYFYRVLMDKFLVNYVGH